MSIDWAQFTPGSAALGGVLIGLAAALLLLGNGRIAGISGIVGGLLRRPQAGDFAWRVAFAAGLLLAPTLYGLVYARPEVRVDAAPGLLVAAGLLVGFGARYGSGCTSGHGVCGVSRLAPRSLIATAIFIGAGFLSVFVVRHLIA